MQTLAQSLHYFTEEARILSCLSVSYGDAHHAVSMRSGRMREQIPVLPASADLPVTTDTLYDLASLTKLFTGIALMQLWDAGRLRLDAPVTSYAPCFSRLGTVSVADILGFQVMLQTPARVDAQPDREAALQTLFQVEARPLVGERVYSDMHAMVLKYVIEAVTGRSYWDVLQSAILQPARMAHTYAAIPASLLPHAACYNYEHRLERGQWLVQRGILPGMPHDPKARLLSPHGEDLCGHAGLFSTEGDMIRFCQALLQGVLLPASRLREMAVNRTGRRLSAGHDRQYLGYQCYVKHPVLYHSEIPTYMSHSAIGISGFTGNHLSVDIETGVFALFLGNRCINRLTTLLPAPGKTQTDYGLYPDGSGRLQGPEGWVYSSVDYVHQKDARLHEPIRRALELPCLTDDAQ